MPAALPSIERVSKIVGVVAGRRARRQARSVAGWWADREDLEHEGVQAALEARRRVDARTMDAEAYVARAADLAMGALYVRMSSPASASDHERPALIDVARAPVDENLSDERRQDRLLELQRWRRRVRQRLAALAIEPALVGAVMSLCHDVAPREAARLCGVQSEDVYAARRKLVDLCRSDATLYRLMRECP